MKGYYQAAFLCLTLLELVGCSRIPTIEHIEQFQPISLNDAEVMPDPSQLSWTPPRIVTLVADQSQGRYAHIGIDRAMSRAFDNILLTSGATLVDRHLAQSLEDELTLAEIAGQDDYQGQQVADYAARLTAEATNYTRYFSAARLEKDDKGKLKLIKAQCRYEVGVQGRLDIYTIPELNRVDHFDLSHVKRLKDEVNKAQDCQLRPDQVESWARVASAEALQDHAGAIKTLFAAQGYVLAMREDEDSVIVQMSLGKAQYAMPGTDVQILDIQRYTNPLTEKAQRQTSIVATGRISDQVYDNTSWIVLDDADSAASIRRGQQVRLIFE